MRGANPAWKVSLAVLSLLLTVFVWTKGLEKSFERPSVTPKLSLHQHEMALLAEPALPSPLRSPLVGGNPPEALRETLRKIPLEEMNDRDRLVLAGLEPLLVERSSVLSRPLKGESFVEVQKALLSSSSEGNISAASLDQLIPVAKDPLLNKVICSALFGDVDKCIDIKTSKNMALRIFLAQVFPFFAVILGVVFLLGQIWRLVRGKGVEWPELTPLPLSLIDMVLLVAGGFVLLGEVIFPTLVVPISQAFTQGIESPLRDSLQVIIGYVAMTIPPLLILRQQLLSLRGIESPPGGWLQWRFVPFNSAFFKALRGWLMVIPLVLLTGWIVNLVVGDQGGSNPLLELVLKSRDPFALILLIITTVVLAPLFEELVFRGVLLPVLAKGVGSFWGIIVSALVFALAHLSVGELAPLFVLGIGLSILRLSSGRLFPCMLMHSLWNGVTFTSLLLLGG